MQMRLFAVAFVAALGLAAGAAAAAEMPTWQIGPMKDMGPGWGSVAKDGKREYRPTRAGREATITVPAWWGKSFRPAEGTIYDLKITYKDTATQPIVFSSHAGVAGGWGMSEVHRFGGLGDGQWKVAHVPVSWDLVCRKNVPFQGPSDQTEFGIRANKDLPVESVEVTMAGPDAAARYGAESRAWVARVQADRRVTIEPRPGQKPVIPEAMKAEPAIAYARSYLVTILQENAPQKDEAGAALKVRMARNEFESVAFGVYANGKDLTGVTYKVSDLTDAEGEKLACEVDCRTAEYAVVGSGGRYRMGPQRLWPMYPANIAKGQSHWFWINVRTLGEKSKPGKYTGTVQIEAKGAKASLPIEVEVLPVTLPTMQEAGLECGTCVTSFLPAQDLKALAESNHTGLDLWIHGTRPQMRIVDGKVQLDFAYLDDGMKYAKQYGMDHMMWFLGGDPYGFPNTMSLERYLYTERDGAGGADRVDEFITKAAANPEEILPEIRDLYVQWVRLVAERGKAKGWPSKLILHPFDEPAKWVQSKANKDGNDKIIGTGPWIKDHFIDGAGLIREGGKGFDNILVGGDIHHAKPGMPFVKVIDVFCTNAIHEDPQLGDKVREAGTQFWQYSGGNTDTPPHQGRFTYGFYFAAFDSRGTLSWAYNWMSRFDTARDSQWGYGWYTPFGNVPSSWMYGKREGWDDRRWIEAYKAKVGPEKAKALLEPIYAEAVAQRNQKGRDTVSDFYAEMQRFDKMNDWRNRIIDAVVGQEK